MRLEPPQVQDVFLCAEWPAVGPDGRWTCPRSGAGRTSYNGRLPHPDCPAPPVRPPIVIVSAADPPVAHLHPITQGFLNRFASRRKWLLIARGVAAAVLTLMVAATAIVIVDFVAVISDPLRWGLSLAAYAAAIAAGIRMGWWRAAKPDSHTLAREVQSASPKLKDHLLSAVELAADTSAPDPAVQGSTRFRTALQDNIARRVSLLQTQDLLPWRLIQKWAIAATVVVSLACVLMVFPPMQWGRRLARAMLPGISIQRAAITQLEIIAPSPPSRFVAEGDAVAIIANVGRLGDGEVSLQWIDADGNEGVQSLSPRQRRPARTGSESAGPFSSDADVASASDVPEDLATAQAFAGNITVGSVPLRYRVLAGDAVSLWHDLTPLPRPAVVQVTKRYVYPKYTQLEPFTQTDPHGDLSAVIGTVAELTVEFDQPVRDAVLRYGLRGRPESMTAVDGSETQFTARVPIQMPTSYQADAVSIRSELSQPFGPQYNITPIPDSPPMALWDQVPDARIISPLAAVELSAIAEDDLPMDRLIQEIQVNNDPLITRAIEVEGNSRKIEAAWLWDMVDRDGDREEDSRKLKAGDTLRSRVVAIDRRGIRGESEFIEWLIADQGIDVAQHERLRHVTEVVRKLSDHWHEQTAMLKFAEDSMGDAGAIPDEAWFEQVDQWTESCLEIKSILKTTVAISPSQYDGVVWARLAGWIQASQLATEDLISRFKHRRDNLPAGPSNDKRDRDERRQLASKAREIRQNVDDLEIVAVGLLGTEMAAARVGDAITLRRSLAPVVDVDRPLPIERFPRYVNLATARLLELSELGSAGAELMPRSAITQMRNFTKWAQTWHARLSNEITELAPERHQQLRNSVRQFENDLRNQIAHSLLDNNLIARMNSSVDKLERRAETLGEPIERLARAGANQQAAEAKADDASDIDDVARWRSEAESKNREFDQVKQQWLAVVNDRESLQRKLPQTDLRFAADLNLIRAAITNVTRDGYGPYKDEPADEVLRNISRATVILDAAADLESARRVLAECGEKERSISYGADAKVRQPNRIEHYLAVAYPPIARLQKSGVDWSLLEAIDATRYNDDASRARTQITTRRWSAGPDSGAVMVRGDGAIGQLMTVYRTRLPGLEPIVTEARQTIQRYVESLSEQARRAAEAADQAAEKNTETKPSQVPQNEETDNAPPSNKETTAEQAALDAERQAAEMIQALIDRANNADVWSEAEKRAEDLEISRDADAASALIDEARKRAQDAREEAAREGSAEEGEMDLADALRQLRDELEQVAEHFENLESGRDASQTRQSLRDQAEQTNAERKLEPLRQAIEQSADEMNVSPEERLKQLEAELQNDPAMREELSKIAEQAIQAAANRMEQAAEEENEVRRQLEDADPRIQEAKRRIRAELAAMTRTAADVDTALMNRSNQAISAAPQANDDGPQLQKARDELQEARRQISEAIAQANSLRGNNELVERMKSASAAMAQALKDAANTAQSLQATADDLVEDSENAEFENSEAEKRAEQLRAARSRQMQQVARQSLTDQGRSANADKDRWREVSRDAFRRVRDAKKQVNDAQKKLRGLEQRRSSAEKRGNLSEVENLDSQIANEKAREQVAQTAVEAAEKTAEIATSRSEQASDRQTELQKSALPPLETANPPAELTSRLASQAAEQLANLAERAEAISGRIPDSVDPDVTAARAQPIADRQRQIAGEVSNAAADLQRASRHERRLDRQLSADALADAAAQVMQQAQPAAQRASEALQNEASDEKGSDSSPPSDAASPPSGGASDPPQPSAAEQTKSAEAAIRETAQVLGGAGDTAQRASETGSEDTGSNDSGSDDSGSPSAGGDPSQSQAGRENAQQLDELDRALHQSPSQSADGDPSDSQSASSPSDPSGQPSQPGQDSPQGSSAAPPSTPTAGQLSPTMAAGMQRKLQSAARQRQQLLDPPETSSGEGDADEQTPDTQPPNASDPSNTAGAGDPPAGGDVDPDRGDRSGDDWGSLRARTTDDATGTTLQRVPPAYRKQLEAYFREIARRGGERQP